MAGGEARVNYVNGEVVVENTSDAVAHEARVNYVVGEVIVENTGDQVPHEARLNYVNGEVIVQNVADQILHEARVNYIVGEVIISIHEPPTVYESDPTLQPVLAECGLSVRIVGRGGGDLVDIPPIESLTFTRRLDEQSTCTIRIPAGSKFTAAEWRHELEVRDNWGRVVWAGPVVDVEDGYDDPSVVQARDLSCWFDRRFVYRDRTYTQDDLAQIFAQLARDALEPDPSPNISIVTRECGVLGDRVYAAATYEYAGDKLRELARTGVDYTAIGRRLLIGGAVTDSGVWRLAAPMVAKAKRRRRGLHLADDVAVVGATVTTPATDDTEATVHTATGRSADPVVIADRGLLQARFNETDIRDDGSAEANAVTRRELLADVVADVEVLLVAGEFSLAELVCGIEVDADIPADKFPEQSMRGVKGRRRLSTVSVTADARGMRTTVTLQPLGTTEAQPAAPGDLFYAGNLGVQSATGATQSAAFNTAISDPRGLLDTATGEVTVDRDAVWVFSFGGDFGLDPGDTVTASLAVNGVVVDELGTFTSVNDANVVFTQSAGPHATPNHPLAAGEYPYPHVAVVLAAGDVVSVQLDWVAGSCALAAASLAFQEQAAADVPPWPSLTVF